MKIAIIALTDRGIEKAHFIGEEILNSYAVDFYFSEKGLNQSRQQGKSFQRLNDIIPGIWQEYQVLIFIMAAGIVVRQIAPLIKRKDCDPAVLVLDEDGKFVIPLLSGHLGGANFWAKHLAREMGATAVITTATDVRGLVAPDEYARRYGWKVEPLEHLPAVNSLFLKQGYLSFWTSLPFEPQNGPFKDNHYIYSNEKDKANIIIEAFFSTAVKEECIYLIPPVLSIGVGCRRGISAEIVMESILHAVRQIGASPKAISGLNSIDIKSNEAGLIEAAKRLRVPFKTFRADELQKVIDQNDLNRSEFVAHKIGVDGVCEAASLLGTREGRLVLPKIKGNGITIAISVENFLSWGLDPGTQTI